MRYTRPKGALSSRWKKTDRKRKRSPTQNLRAAAAEIKPRALGGPNNNFLRRYGLDKTSHPMDWSVAFMPQTLDDNKENPALANFKGDRTTKFAVSNWTASSNAKAVLIDAKQKGHIFAAKYKPFTNADIFQMLGVYIIDGIAPSPQLQQKMQPQLQQPMHGNDKIASVMGTRYQQKYHSFQTFFACQDPLTMPPPKDQCPNFKVDEFFRWLHYIWKEAWCLSEEFSNNKHTLQMQGKSEYKTRIEEIQAVG